MVTANHIHRAESVTPTDICCLVQDLLAAAAGEAVAGAQQLMIHAHTPADEEFLALPEAEWLLGAVGCCPDVDRHTADNTKPSAKPLTCWRLDVSSSMTLQDVVAALQTASVCSAAMLRYLLALLAMDADACQTCAFNMLFIP